MHRVEVAAGDTLLLPAGWAHAVATPVDCLAFGGELYHCGGLEAHLQAWRVQQLLGVRPWPRFPLFKQLMWRTAQHYASALATAARTCERQRSGGDSPSSEGSSEMPGGTNSR